MSNPFEKLNVKRDESDDDEEGEFQKVKGKAKNVPIGLEQKKKKSRPVEKVQDEDNEGFEEVPNKMRKKKPVNDDEEEEVKGGEHKKRKGINYQTVEDKEYRTKDKPKRGRQFDRHSGTGRGKEIAKGGAGGKGTWGENPKNIARDFENNNEENDDYYFESALNPEKRKEKPPKKPKKEDKKEGEEGEEKNEEEKKENKNKKERKYEPKPLTEEEKLNKPKDAISLEDFLKSKEKPKEDEEKKEVKRIQDGKPLVKKEEKTEELLGTSGAGRKKGKKRNKKKSIKKN